MANQEHIAKFAARGKTDGAAAATWFFDREVTGESYREVLKGIEDGDPMIMDSLPFADLSGQWADAPTAESIAKEELSEEELSEYLQTEDVGDGETGPSLSQWYDFDELITAYEDAYSSAAQDAIEKECRFHLEPV